MTETQLRFLRAIGERLPIGRVAELYLFPPMRQGNAESGIAVIAAVRELDVPNEPSRDGDSAADEAELSAAGLATASAGDDVALAPPDLAAGEACDPTEDASRDDTVLAAHAGEDAAADESSAVDGAHDAAEVAAAADATATAELDAEPAPVPPMSGASSGVVRHTVYTARYRLTLKGPERGKWELNVVEEADAPLLSVEVVVRGVQHRVGEGAEPERLEPAALRELLGIPAA